MIGPRKTVQPVTHKWRKVRPPFDYGPATGKHVSTLVVLRCAQDSERTARSTLGSLLSGRATVRFEGLRRILHEIIIVGLRRVLEDGRKVLHARFHQCRWPLPLATSSTLPQARVATRS